MKKSHPRPLQQVLEGSEKGACRNPSSVRFTGYAAIFDAPDLSGDVVRRGAFRAGPGPVPLLCEHRRGRAVGRIEEIAQDATGLRVSGRIEDAGVAAMVARGEIGGLSFGYRVREARRRAGSDGRELIGLDLVEVSLVARPMQPLARVEIVGNSVEGGRSLCPDENG